jgi:hypothetical protein
MLTWSNSICCHVFKPMLIYYFIKHSQSPKAGITVEWLVLLLCIWEVPSSNLSTKTCYPDRFLSLFPNHYSLVNLSFNGTQSELPTTIVQLNKHEYLMSHPKRRGSSQSCQSLILYCSITWTILPIIWDVFLPKFLQTMKRFTSLLTFNEHTELPISFFWSPWLC